MPKRKIKSDCTSRCGIRDKDREMKCLILVLAVVAMVTPPTAAVPHERQAPSCRPPTNAQCITAITNSVAVIATAVASSAGPISVEPPNRANVQTALNTLCGSTCFSQTRDFYRCAGQEQYFTSAVCGKHSGVFCFVRLIDRLGDNMPAIPNCAVGTTSCSSNCSTSLTQARDQLGCCAAGLYNSTGSPLAVLGRQYTTCQVNLGQRCGEGSGAASVFYLSGALLVAIASVAVAIL